MKHGHSPDARAPVGRGSHGVTTAFNRAIDFLPIGTGATGSHSKDSAGPSTHEMREDVDSPLSFAKRSGLLLAVARVLYVNGQTTDETLAAVERIARALRLRTTMVPRWGELHLEAEDRDARLVSVVAANPTSVHMIRVESLTRTVEGI